MAKQQFSLDFPISTDYDSNNFVLSEANHEVHTWVTSWPGWNAHGLVIYGPQDSGKTHLAHIWQNNAQAVMIQASSLTEECLPRLFRDSPYYIVENIECIPEEATLFHLLNHVKAQGGAILMTSLKAPNQLQFSLADLHSRINALPAVSIELPDDGLLKAVLIKHFSDRQLRVSDDTVDFLISRMERSFAMAKHVANILDKAALQQHCRITIPFVKQILGL